MSCCLETAILNTIRALENTPICSDNHFVDRRKCSDCMPYLVLKTSVTSGLKTSSGVQKHSSIDIKAYFTEKMGKESKAFRDLMENWVFVTGCIELGECGCFCLQNDPISAITTTNDGTIVYSLSFRGVYRQNTESESV